jgi:predicted permease
VTSRDVPPRKGAPAWRRYLRFWGHDAARDLDDELRFHIEARYDEYIAAGMTPAQARAAVDQRFGNVAAVQAQCATIDSQWRREQTLMDLLTRIVGDFRYAIRQLRRNASLSVAAILCFALGVGANTSIFSVVDAVLFRPLPFADPSRLVLVGEGLPSISDQNFGVISAPEVSDYERLNGRVFTNMAIYQGSTFALSGSGEPERVNGLVVSSAIFGTLGVPIARGRSFSASDDGASGPDVAILSDALWHRRYNADPNILGRAIDVDGKPATVVGILPASFKFPLPGIGGEPAELFVPYRMTAAFEQQRANGYDAFLVARLAPAVSIDAARRAVSDIAASFPLTHPDVYRGDWKTVADVFPLRDRAVKDVRQPLLILLGAVALVLLIACLNVSSLLLARAAARQREISVRQALGASRGRLIQQFLAESVTLVAIGGALGLLFAVWGARVIASRAPRQVLQGYDASIDLRVFGATAAVLLVTAIAFSLVPALSRSVGSPASTLRGEGRSATAGRDRQRARRTLVVAEIALALMLATAASLMVRSFVRARAVDPGFDPANVLTFRVGLPPTRYPTADGVTRFEQTLADRIASIPGVTVASATSNLPMTTPRHFAFSVEGSTATKVPLAAIEFVLPKYFDAVRIPIRSGRALGDGDRAGTLPAVMVNQALEKRFFGSRGAVGRRIKWGSPGSTDPWLTIVGVAADVKESGLDQPTEPQIYFPIQQQDSTAVQGLLRAVTYVVRTSRDPRSLMNAVRQAVRESDPNLPIVALQPMTDVVSTSVSERRYNTLLLSAFALLALTLASVGIYGLIAFSVVQRTREIGVRLALGATSLDVLRLVVGQGTRLALVGVGIGLVGAVAITRLLRTLLFDVSPLDPAAFVGASAALLVVAVVASYLPARRASRIDAQSAIRAE